MRRAIEPALQRGELLEGGPLDLDALREDAVGLAVAAGLVERGGDRAEDHAARLRDALAEPRDRTLPGALGLVEAAERQQRLDLDHHGHRQQVGVRVAAAGQQLDRPLGVLERLAGAAGAQPHLGARAAEDGEREAVVRRSDSAAAIASPICASAPSRSPCSIV